MTHSTAAEQKSFFSIAALLALVAGCSHPVLQEPSGPSATLRIENRSVGYVNVMLYTDPETCTQPNRTGVVQPGETLTRPIPAGQVITLSAGAWGAPGIGSWCQPLFISTKLEEGITLTLRYTVDAQAKRCTLASAVGDGASPAIVERRGTGGLFTGVLAGPTSCSPEPALKKLAGGA